VSPTRVLALLALLVAPLASCGGASGPRPDVAQGYSAVTDGEVVDFQVRADAFYKRLSKRRVNTIATFQDRVLRDYFQNEAAFSDYYANLAQALVDAHFERNRPLSAEVQEFALEAPGRARVRFRMVGENGLPLRFWRTSIEREDRWERVDGQWWVTPGKL
jgi:hypothetical protein